MGRKRHDAPGDKDDPALVELRQADAEYHRLCIEIQEPYVPKSELPLEELELAVDRLAAAIRAIRGQPDWHQGADQARVAASVGEVARGAASRSLGRCCGAPGDNGPQPFETTADLRRTLGVRRNRRRES